MKVAAPPLPTSDEQSRLSEKPYIVSPAELLEINDIKPDNEQLARADRALGIATAIVETRCRRDFAFPPVNERRQFLAPTDSNEMLVVDDFTMAETVAICRGTDIWPHGKEIRALQTLTGKPVRGLADTQCSVTLADENASWANFADENGWLTISATWGWLTRPEPIRAAVVLAASPLLGGEKFLPLVLLGDINSALDLLLRPYIRLQ